MKSIAICFMLLVITCSFGCGSPAQQMARQQMKYAHDEKMAEIKAQKNGMSEEEKKQLADMIADMVVERLQQQN